MAFEVRLGGVLAGEAQLAVGEIGEFDGHRAVVVKSRAATAGAAALIKHIVDEATTVIDVDTGRPLALDTLVEHGGKQTTATATFAGTVADVTYHARPTIRAPHTLHIDFGTKHGPRHALRDGAAPRLARRAGHDAHGLRRRRAPAVARRCEVRRRPRRSARALGNRARDQFDGSSFRARREPRRRVATSPRARSRSGCRTMPTACRSRSSRAPSSATSSMDLTEYNRP